MIAVDTNIIIRFLVRDDEMQALAVYKRFSQAEKNGKVLFVPLVVVLETIWVLESAYQKPRLQIIESFEEKGSKILSIIVNRTPANLQREMLRALKENLQRSTATAVRQ